MGSLRFKPRAGQIEHSMLAAPQRLKRAVFPGAMTRKWAPQIYYTLWPDKTSTIKGLIFDRFCKTAINVKLLCNL